MMFSSIIGKFKDLTQSSDTDNPSCQSSSTPNGHANDVEEDGFLVIGDTVSERTSVLGSQFDNSINAPPTYNEIQSYLQEEMPPSYMDVSSTSLPLPPTTAISGVPFQLTPALSVLKDVQENMSYSILSTDTQFDWNYYDYDFHNEIAFLTEYGGMEQRYSSC